MSRQNNQPEALLEIWDVLLRYRWRFILPAFLICAMVLGGSLLLPRKYKAEAVFDRRTDMVLAEITNRGATSAFQDPRQSLHEEIAGQVAIEQLTTKIKPFIYERINRMGMRTDPVNLHLDLERKLTVNYDIATANLDRIRITYVSDDPELARLVVNTLVLNYIDRTRMQLDQRLREAAAFFQNEVTVSRERIEKLEGEHLNFEIQHADLLPDNPNNIQSALSEAQAKLADISQRRDDASSRIESIKNQLAETPEEIPSIIKARNPELAHIEAKLRQDEATLHTYVATYKMTEKHPDVIALRQQIAGIKLTIEGMETEVVTQRHLNANPKREKLELELADVTSTLQSLDRQHELVRADVERLNLETTQLFPVRADYRKLSREIEQAQRQIAFWEDNLRRVQMALTAESGNRGIRLDFILPCGQLTKPISPAVTQVMLAAIGFAMVAGAVGVFFAHRMDESFSDGEKMAEALSLPLVGSVSEIISQQQKRMRRIRSLIIYPVNITAMALVLGLLMGMVYLYLERPMPTQASASTELTPAASQTIEQDNHSNPQPNAAPSMPIVSAGSVAVGASQEE